MVHRSPVAHDAVDSGDAAGPSVDNGAAASGGSSRKAAEAAVRSSLESDTSYDEGDYDVDEEARLFADHKGQVQHRSSPIKRAAGSSVLYDVEDAEDGNDEVAHAHTGTPSAHDSDVHRFEDRRETGGWTTRLKGRGAMARAWEIAREVSKTPGTKHRFAPAGRLGKGRGNDTA